MRLPSRSLLPASSSVPSPSPEQGVTDHGPVCTRSSEPPGCCRAHAALDPDGIRGSSLRAEVGLARPAAGAPGWFADAKFGIFIHWGPYSVPAWAPVGTYFPSGINTGCRTRRASATATPSRRPRVLVLPCEDLRQGLRLLPVRPELFKTQDFDPAAPRARPLRSGPAPSTSS